MNTLGEYIMFLRMTATTTTTVVLETLNITATAIMVHALQKIYTYFVQLLMISGIHEM